MSTSPLPLARQEIETLVTLLNPFAPHLSDECWSQLGHEQPLAVLANHEEAAVVQATGPSSSIWPKADPAFLQEEQVMLRVMVDGKFVSPIELTVEEEESLASLFETSEEAKAEDTTGVAVKDRLFEELGIDASLVRKEIYVRGKVFSIITQKQKGKKKKGKKQ